MDDKVKKVLKSSETAERDEAIYLLLKATKDDIFNGISKLNNRAKETATLLDEAACRLVNAESQIKIYENKHLLPQTVVDDETTPDVKAMGKGIANEKPSLADYVFTSVRKGLETVDKKQICVDIHSDVDNTVYKVFEDVNPYLAVDLPPLIGTEEFYTGDFAHPVCKKMKQPVVEDVVVQLPRTPVHNADTKVNRKEEVSAGETDALAARTQVPPPVPKIPAAPPILPVLPSPTGSVVRPQETKQIDDEPQRAPLLVEIPKLSPVINEFPKPQVPNRKPISEISPIATSTPQARRPEPAARAHSVPKVAQSPVDSDEEESTHEPNPLEVARVEKPQVAARKPMTNPLAELIQSSMHQNGSIPAPTRTLQPQQEVIQPKPALPQQKIVETKAAPPQQKVVEATKLAPPPRKPKVKSLFSSSSDEGSDSKEKALPPRQDPVKKAPVSPKTKMPSPTPRREPLKQATTKPIFDDESDTVAPSSSKTIVQPTKPTPSIASRKPLFDDSDDDEEFFSKPKTNGPAAISKSNSLKPPNSETGKKPVKNTNSGVRKSMFSSSDSD